MPQHPFSLKIRFGSNVLIIHWIFSPFIQAENKVEEDKEESKAGDNTEKMSLVKEEKGEKEKGRDKKEKHGSDEEKR